MSEPKVVKERISSIEDAVDGRELSYARTPRPGNIVTYHLRSGPMVVPYIPQLFGKYDPDKL